MASGILVPIGMIDKKLLELLAGILTKTFFITFSIAEPIDILEHAFNARRKQYYSTSILKTLRETYHAEKVLGIIDKDLFVPDLNFVFGEADIHGRVAVISITRLRQEFYGLPHDENVFFDRVVKEAVHELGHTYGLRHCSDHTCVMFFSNSLLDTERKSRSFCSRCMKKLETLR